MTTYKNLFIEFHESQLKIYYEQLKEFWKTGFLPDNDLGKIRDEYCEFNILGLTMMEKDLLDVIAENWYKNMKY